MGANGHDRGVSGPYLAGAQVLLAVTSLHVSELVELTPPWLVQLSTVCEQVKPWQKT